MKNCEFWPENIHIRYHPPVGIFTQSANVIVHTLLQAAHNNAPLALHRLMFYMNRAGKNLPNADELELAKCKLEEIIRNRRH